MFKMSERATYVTPRQFAIWRIVFGSYLLIYLARLLPFATELYSREGIITDTHYIAAQNGLPAWILAGDSKAAIYAVFAASFVLALGFVAGFYRRAAALGLWGLLTWLMWRCPYTLGSPERPFLQWLLLAASLVPEGEAYSLGKKNPRWHMPREIYLGAWLVFTVGYFYSGWSKWFSADPAWRDGTALYYVMNTDGARRLWYGNFFLRVPVLYLMPATWFSVALEGMGVFCLPFRRVRVAWNLSLLAMHAMLVFIVKLDQVSLGMCVAHLFLWDAGANFMRLPGKSAET